MTLSFHVVNVPCPEEYYMGVSADYEAHWVDIPDEYFPKALLDIIKDKSKNPAKRITSIAIHKEGGDE